MSTKLNENGELVLFAYTQPDMAMDGLTQTARKNQDGSVVGLNLTLESRKDMSSRLKLGPKSSELMAKRLEASNRIKEIGIGEALKMAASPEWTGARVAVSRNKAGTKRFSLSLVTVKDGRTVTEEQLVKALAAMPEDERLALLEQAETSSKGVEVVEA